ncbi:CHAD domain-containing protein [Kitasatospora viridis]|uniref:CHAD domain-containing protein n=1 Tax=Kitasatospora viridis TaxID=281105 RepID=A0A561UPX9_9ACTN|nr:CHAD domain-containing protein [Kitasatospora viridis]TWG01419.1 CHAD domain-containing protein [Kitasatospora viridis]
MAAEPARTRALAYQGLPSRPVRPRGLPHVAAVVPAGAGEPARSVRVCWDTADLRLIAHGVLLERSAGPAGAPECWLATLPDGTEHRAAALAELDDRLRAYTAGRPLRPALRISSRRTRSLLLDRERHTLAELDRTESLAQRLGDRAARLAGWDRTEVRLVAGRRGLLHELDARLRADGLTAAPAGVPVPAPVPVSGRGGGRAVEQGTAGAALAGYLRDQSAELLALDGAVRRDEADSVHRMRVCARRLRSALTAGRPLLRGRRRVAELAGELRWLGRVLGEARDAETTGERLLAGAAERPGTADGVSDALRLVFRERYAQAFLTVREVLDGERYFALLAELERIAAAPPLRARAGRGKRELERLVRGERRRTGRRLRTALALPPGAGRDEALHGARKAAKRARYAAELAGATRLATRLHAVQDALGRYQDAVVAQALLPELAARARAAGADTFGYGVLYAAQRPEAEAALAAALPAWRRARGRRLCRVDR